MKITSLEEYGLRCMVQLARHSDREPLTIAEIAQEEGLSLPYVGKLMNLLRQEGLVMSVRGRAGGYILPRPADQITLDTVITALGGDLFDKDHCGRHPAGHDVCVHSGDCSIRSVWSTMHRIINDTLKKTSLSDLVGTENQVSQTLEMPASAADGEREAGGIELP
ncbi:MAG: Rrf2 family transcriptional regulator [Candidatus Eisenbacteria bacterium]|nr:Rrf2 family transcriptional regulator [Candidatus Eisenbacteria bacterium]MBU1949826.1 Rrf2 family transcriptional regulator [Candidatus Eisenbacteria bacterium]